MSHSASIAHDQNWFTLRNLWLSVVPFGLFMRLCLSSVFPEDFWWHVRTGQLILQERAIPVADLFSYTQAGEPWVNQAWLMQVVFALLMAWGGVPLVIFVHALTLAASYTLILRACAPRFGVRISVWATLMGALIGVQNWALRPQSVSFLAFALLIVMIEAHRHGKRRALWWAMPLFALWVNAHGAFVFGLAALGLYVVGTLWDALWTQEWRTRRGELLELSAQGLMALAVLAINPQGPTGIMTYVLGFFQSKATLQYNVEFGPLMIRAADGIAFALAILLLFVVRINSTTRLTTSQTLMLLAFATMTLLSRRSAAWFGMVQIPVLASLLHGWWQRPSTLHPGKPILTATIFGLFLLFSLLLLPWWRPYMPQLAKERPLLAATTPVEAASYLCEKFAPGTRGYQEIGFASYLEAACPTLPVFMDTRFELYPITQWDDYIDMKNGRYNWTSIAEQYDMEYLLVALENQPHLVAAAQTHHAWKEIYRDDRALIFQRQRP